MRRLPVIPTLIVASTITALGFCITYGRLEGVW